MVGSTRSRVRADSEYTYVAETADGCLSCFRLSLSLLQVLIPLVVSCNAVGDLSFPCLSIPQSHLLRLSLVGSKAVSQRRSAATRERSLGRDMNSRSSFYIPRSPALHFACSSPLSTSPICDYRMCRPHGLSRWSHSFSRSLFPPVYAPDHSVPTSSFALLFCLFLLFRFSAVAVVIVIDDQDLRDVNRSRKIRYGRGEQSREGGGNACRVASRREKRREDDPQIFNDMRMQVYT